MDSVYFKRLCVYLVVRDWHKRKNIYFKNIAYETIAEYVEAILELENKEFIIDGIVIDGRKGIFEALSSDYPIQMCQFHQKKIIQRYLTSKPKTKAAIDLKSLTKSLPDTNEITFRFFLDLWHVKYHRFLKERTINSETKRWFYTHKRLRSAYRSLRNNLSYLFTYQKVNGMPNTTNSLDGFFAHLKDGVRIHRGLKLHRRKKLIEYLISRS